MHPAIPEPLHALCRASAQIGQGALLVQAAGGNTSIKQDGQLWVKASGGWLARACDTPMFVPLDLDVLRRGLVAGDETAAQRARLDLPGTEGLRPSIETSLHALLPHAVVMHAHPVGALSWLSCRTPDGVFAERLAGLDWRRVPYVRPGLPLTLAVRDAVGDAAPDVLLLDQHGVVAGGATVDAALALLLEVARRLDSPCAISAEPDDDALRQLQALAAGTGWQPAGALHWHALARDPVQRAFARGGAPYPDHVVFLGAGLPCCAADPQAVAAADAGPALLVEGLGLLVAGSADASTLAMLGCLADVASRIAARPGAEPVYLPAAEVQALGQWEAERYRRQGAVSGERSPPPG